MAAIKYVDLANLTQYDGLLKTYIDSEKTKGLKHVKVVDNKINFYANPNPAEGAVADFSVDMPVEYFLDQAKTVLIQEFAWSAETYPGSANPELDGKAVLVLAVKGDDGSVTYSFLNMETLISIYTGGITNSVIVAVDSETNEITASIKISEEEGNILSIKEDGLYAEAILDISGKADKLAEVKAGQILVDDGNGNLAASGQTVAELNTEILGNFEAISTEEISALFA